MERHKCKLCSRGFANGRALGGHMKAHLATLPLAPKTEQPTVLSMSSSSSSSSEDEQQWKSERNREAEEKALIYGLRENPKKSFRLADPGYSFAVDAGFVVLDRESETESKNPTRRRSKRNRRSSIGENQKVELKKPKLIKLSLSESPTEPEPASSVSDTSPEEDIAMCLMMLSRDIWKRNKEENQDEEETLRSVDEFKGLEKIKCKRARGKNQCENCRKTFRSSRALISHKKICFRDEAEAKNAGNDGTQIFKCPYCYKVFGSGQALGGHKRSHLIASSSTTATDFAKLRENVIDLNLPAPAEEDEFSVLSDA
ncbi:Zinc finger protein [Quillaja saponaria]|uniref:Zinc finger protein n=1 Tax=Quillaja saponaria TaxID=32244 RepID=A0AAD7P7A4_QUISA|nr:Zinc finger protein [Quillaja saponaria]